MWKGEGGATEDGAEVGAEVGAGGRVSCHTAVAKHQHRHARCAARLPCERRAVRRLCEAPLLVERPVVLVHYSRQPEVAHLGRGGGGRRVICAGAVGIDREPEVADCVPHTCCAYTCYAAADLDVAGAAEQDVGGLEVAVEDVGRVQVLECHEQLLGDPLHVRDGDGLRRCDQLAQVEVHVVKAHPEVGEGALRCRVQAVSDPAAVPGSGRAVGQ